MRIKVSRSAKAFLERTGLLPTERPPKNTLSPDLNQAHNYPLAAPLPNPQSLRAEAGPDRAGVATEWPPTGRE